MAADEVRKYPSQDALAQAETNKPFSETPFGKPYNLLDLQAAECHPGNKPKEIEAREILARKLAAEFHVLKRFFCKPMRLSWMGPGVKRWR